MSRVLCVGLAVVAVVVMGGVGPARADNGPHMSRPAGVGFSQLVGAQGCADCHRAHTAASGSPLSAGQDAICLDCHGPAVLGSTTDVIDGVGYAGGAATGGPLGTSPGALRGGGFEYALIGSGEATKQTYLSGTGVKAKNQNIPVLASGHVATSSHMVSGTTRTPWSRSEIGAGTGGVELNCVSCHDPHGNGSFAILRAIPSGPTASTHPVPVKVPDVSVKVYTTTNYWLTGDASTAPVEGGVPQATGVPDGFIANIAQWCTTCHSAQHADTNSVMGVGTNCITCHVSHGSNATMSGADGASMSGPDAIAIKAPDALTAWTNSYLLRVDNGAACLMCHNV